MNRHQLTALAIMTILLIGCEAKWDEVKEEKVLRERYLNTFNALKNKNVEAYISYLDPEIVAELPKEEKEDLKFVLLSYLGSGIDTEKTEILGIYFESNRKEATVKSKITYWLFFDGYKTTVGSENWIKRNGVWYVGKAWHK